MNQHVQTQGPKTLCLLTAFGNACNRHTGLHAAVNVVVTRVPENCSLLIKVDNGVKTIPHKLVGMIIIFGFKKICHIRSLEMAIDRGKTTHPDNFHTMY